MLGSATAEPAAPRSSARDRAARADPHRVRLPGTTASTPGTADRLARARARRPPRASRSRTRGRRDRRAGRHRRSSRRLGQGHRVEPSGKTRFRVARHVGSTTRKSGVTRRLWPTATAPVGRSRAHAARARVTLVTNFGDYRKASGVTRPLGRSGVPDRPRRCASVRPWSERAARPIASDAALTPHQGAPAVRASRPVMASRSCRSARGLRQRMVAQPPPCHQPLLEGRGSARAVTGPSHAAVGEDVIVLSTLNGPLVARARRAGTVPKGQPAPATEPRRSCRTGSPGTSVGRSWRPVISSNTTTSP